MQFEPDNEVNAAYAFVDSEHEVKLKGKLHSDGKTFELTEVGKSGFAAQKFTGEFLEHDPGSMPAENSKLNCSVAVGKWYDPNANRVYAFYLNGAGSASRVLGE